MRLPARAEPVFFGLVLSGFMSLLVSFVATLRAAGLADWTVGIWVSAWLSSWAVAFPAVLVVAPLARRVVGRLFRA